MVPIVRDIFWFGAALIVALGLANGLRAEPSPSADEGTEPQAAAAGQVEQVVVLRDGGVMTGHVTRSADRYVLERGTGQTFIPASNVMFVAASLEDAYEQQRQPLNGATADHHLKLVEWCLRNDLLTRAEQELAAARTIEPRHDKLELFELRLSLAVERRQKQDTEVSMVPTESKPAAVPIQNAPTNFGDLPPGAIELFTRRVQPVLVNSCTTAGCHEAGGTAKFQLDRAMLRGMSNRRTTMINLAATLELVDREQPSSSPLLTVPRQTHGGMKDPVFGPRREAAFRHLDEWVALVTAETAKKTPAPDARVQDEELVAQQGEPRSRWESSVMRVERPEAGDAAPTFDQESKSASSAGDIPSQVPATASETIPSSPLRYGARLENWQPRDPFDPEIFNRKYSRTAPSANGTIPPVVSARSNGQSQLSPAIKR